MSRTNISAPTLAALAAANVEMFMLLELGFDSGTVYLCDLAFDVPWNGHTYLAAQGIGTIRPVSETDSESRGLVLTLSAVNQAAIAAALLEDVQGRPVTLRLAIVDGGSLRVDPNVWSGAMDTMTVEDNGDQPVIQVTCEHAMIAWAQPSGAKFSDPEQRLRDSGDLFFEYAAKVSETSLVWPSAVFFKV